MANEIRGILIPVANDKKVLLPNAIIAEVVSYKDLKVSATAPDWYVGSVNWRGYENIPVVCYESLSTKSVATRNTEGRIAVIKALGKLEGLPYFAIIVKGVPRLQVVTQGDLQLHELEEDTSNAIASQVTIQDELSDIPNIRFIEHVLNVLLSSTQEEE